MNIKIDWTRMPTIKIKTNALINPKQLLSLMSIRYFFLFFIFNKHKKMSFYIYSDKYDLLSLFVLLTHLQKLY